jgi:hypothetical protein
MANRVFPYSLLPIRYSLAMIRAHCLDKADHGFIAPCTLV